ncbi:SDR family oxidoreductase [Pseudomonas sp. efr-133-TYG-5]|jgi:UDP-glucose 4-epimerase|uniref:UDP-glucose 4-epimerase family protein n=1 Tax=Pseudomonas sp. efr-133-TYG-5 TaxID=3040310 RepID=UPI002557BB6F|nr:SDR family oxidoreductase [Pseudomonas sp. efr-133-TYG-5]
MSRSIFLTGATGFVGKAILSRLVRENYAVITPLRKGSDIPADCIKKINIDAIDGSTDWQGSFADVDVVIHSAARVHVMNDTAVDPLAAFRQINVEGTLNLARQAAAAGVRRFIFISSIKVNGEGTSRDTAYSPDAVSAPVDPYGISKKEAEEGLQALAVETGMDVVIIRPVLVYGPGVKANFRNMMQWLDKGVPLPFGAIHNSRSLVAVDNLVDLIFVCIRHPAAANQIFLVSDGEDLSTTQLLKKMALALDRPPRLLPVPAWIFKFGAAVLGRKDISNRLCGSLRVDITKTRALLGWSPPVSVSEALKVTAQHFRESRIK